MRGIGIAPHFTGCRFWEGGKPDLLGFLLSVRLAVKHPGRRAFFLTESTGETRVEVTLETVIGRATAPLSRIKRKSTTRRNRLWLSSPWKTASLSRSSRLSRPPHPVWSSPETAKEKPQEARVVAVGPGRVDEKGNRIPVDIKEGDVVVFSRYGGTEVKYQGEEYLILSARDVLAIVD